MRDFTVSTLKVRVVLCGAYYINKDDRTHLESVPEKVLLSRM